MSAIPNIPPAVVTLEQLDAWIDREAPNCERAPNEWERKAKRLRMIVAVMDRATEIGARQRAQSTGGSSLR